VEETQRGNEYQEFKKPNQRNITQKEEGVSFFFMF
jgi:hypothetical protein